MALESLQDLYLEQLKDLHSAEEQIIEALPKMIRNTTHTELRKAFELHLNQTKEQLRRLDQIGQRAGQKLTGHKCKAMKGLLEEGEELIKERADSGVHLRVQMGLGLRPDRPGVSLVSYRDDIDPTKVAARAMRTWRADGAPYANTIPGGERMGYRTLATTSELEALVIRGFHYLDTHPDRLERVTEDTGEDASHLPYVRVR